MRQELNHWLTPPIFILVMLTAPALAAWSVVQFSWLTMAAIATALIFPIYSLYIKYSHHVETPQRVRGILLAIIMAVVTLSLSQIHQLTLHQVPLLALWGQGFFVLLLTQYFPKLDLPDTSLKVGKRLPDFVFDDIKGNPITRRYLGEGPVLFYFFRGNWCPFCSAQIHGLMQGYKDIVSEGIQLAFVSSQPHEDMEELAQQFELQANYLVDTELRFSSQYNLVDANGVPAGLSHFGTDTLLPTLMLIDHNNKILMLDRSDNYRLRPEPELVLERVKELGANAYLEKVVAERTKELQAEKEKSEKIILNILPEHTAIELKETGRTSARFYESVTLLFSDFVGFTKVSAGVQPQCLVDSLNAYFEQYDRLVSSIGLEKIKTIGDAYMVAGGLPIQDPDHAQKCCELAIRMLEIGEAMHKKHASSHICTFDCRIGIHTGPVMAGVVGETKFCYDIWGDTVNLAARMESHGEQGRINISAATLAALNGRGEVQARGKVPVKNHQPQEMYFLSNLRG